jgi:predicted restriction endonuclease
VKNGIWMCKNKGKVFDRGVVKNLDRYLEVEIGIFLSEHTCEVAISF